MVGLTTLGGFVDRSTHLNRHLRTRKFLGFLDYRTIQLPDGDFSQISARDSTIVTFVAHFILPVPLTDSWL